MSNNRESLFVLGRQPVLGIAELERLYGGQTLKLVGRDAVSIPIDPGEIAFRRLGGTIKLCSVLASFDTVNWPKLNAELENLLPTLLPNDSNGKLRLGLSCYGFSSISSKQLFAAGLKLKKITKSHGLSVRLVPNQTNALNSAQVLHNQLTGQNGIELVLVRDSNRTVCAKTIAEQDITSYTKRDRGRPMRDAHVGMLPPKLAQIIINMAVGSRNAGQTTVLDPFCGTGVILQEALIMGCNIYGTDLDKRMVSYSKQNLDWLQNNSDVKVDNIPLEVGDATTYLWDEPFDVVASESYLGQAFNSLPSIDKIEENMHTCNIITEKFLSNIAKQIDRGAELCLAVPAWQHKPKQFLHLPLLDHLEKLGYNRLRFQHVRNEDLVYYRDDQIVARELLVITRK